MSGYSHPPNDMWDAWNSAFFPHLIRRSVIRAYTKEIRRLGGRSWLYVQAMGTDLNDRKFQQGVPVIRQHWAGTQPLLDVIAPDAFWAERIAPQWARFAQSLGFSGIHWDMLGDDGDIQGFLRAALPIVRGEGLLQTCNFINGAGWNISLWSDNVITFPYWEVWNIYLEALFFNSIRGWGSGVFACYPGKTIEHEGERQNQRFRGISPFDLLIKRWRMARHNGAAYLAIGDGLRHVQTCYLPDTDPLNSDELDRIMDDVFRVGNLPWRR